MNWQAGTEENRSRTAESSGTQGKREWGMRGFISLLRCEKGANAIEYALVASLIAIAAVGAFNNLASHIDGMYNNVSNHMPG
jgi:pilus assembly protein Flp/PilA